MEKRKGLPEGYTLVRPVVETAAGVKWAYEIASASPRITYMAACMEAVWETWESPWDTAIQVWTRVVLPARESPGGRPDSGCAFPGWRRRGHRTGPGVQTDLAGNGPGHGLSGRVRQRALHPGRHGRNSRGHSRCLHSPLEDVQRWIEILPVLEEAAHEGTILVNTQYGLFDTTCIKTLREEVALAKRLGMV